MFCSECGAQARGKFCSHCGTALLGATSMELVAAQEEHIPADWPQLVDYQAIIRVPAVRDRIARSAAQSKKQMTGEEFLEFYGKLSGVPIPVVAVAHMAQSLHAKLGIKTGKSRGATFATPPGETLVAVLCSLARHGRSLRRVDQRADGCSVVAALPSDLFALEGDLVVSVARHGLGTAVEARTDIQGQMFDWGKSNRCLDQLFAEIAETAVAA